MPGHTIVCSQGQICDAIYRRAINFVLPYTVCLSHSSYRYINDCINQGGWNVEFVKLPEQGCALVVATRPIAAWEELFVSYGKRYWVLQRPIRLSNVQLRAILLVAANAGGVEVANRGDMSNTG
jgi:hypothetical protein